MESIETRFAVVNGDSIVINNIIASSGDTPPDGCILVEVMNDQWCDIGAFWDGNQFIYISNTNGID
jgi:hypothetical protein